MKIINIIIAILFLSLGINELSAQSLNIPLITVNETEVSYAVVDEIHFSVVVKTYDQQIIEARAKNRRIADAVFNYLESKSIPKRYIQTKGMRISRNYLRNRQPEYDGFNAYQRIYVCLKDIDSFDEIIDAVLQMDVAEVYGPEFKSSTYEETLKSARLKALKKAKESAIEMAKALGQRIGKAKLVVTNVANSSNSAYSNPSSNANSSSSQKSFEIGEIEIGAAVQVSFELLE